MDHRPAEAAHGPDIPDSLPLIPVRDLVVFPYMIVPLFVARNVSVAAVEEAMAADRLLFLASQRDMAEENPGDGGIHAIGTVGMVMRRRKLPDGRLKLLVQGLTKGRILRFVHERPYLRVEIEEIPEPPATAVGPDAEALIRVTRKNLQEVIENGKALSPEVVEVVSGIHHPGRLADLVAAHISLAVDEAQALLEMDDPMERLRRVNDLLLRELAVQKVQNEIQAQAREEMSRSQREYILREHLRQIKAELGEGDGRAEEIDELRLRIARARMPPEVETEANKQLRRLEGMSGDSAEAAVIRTYVETLCELPWSVRTEDNLDLYRAKQILDEDHDGLEEVKERLLEYLGVRKLKAETKGPILCLVGPPGVGKTSLGRSVARALGRAFVRVSLGGVRDEAEIRGHRRTYVGAMPGRIIAGIKQAGSRNPVMVLDEIDKLGQDFRGDPSAALLEVLDPEQNNKFRDHYLHVDFDLSEVLFLATANLLEPIPGPLLDRMEVLRIAGYTEWEKLRIAKRHLIPRQIAENGLTAERIRFTDEAVLALIRGYTREAGVRGLEREIASLCRKVARQVAEGRARPVRITPARLERLLGPPRHVDDPASLEDEVGVVTGLAWTQAGGEVLHVEAVAVPGKAGLILTGHLGEVMKESARAALTWVRARADAFGIDPAFFADNEIHIHVPAGAIPKDGPSAGAAMAVALVSLASGVPVRHDVAMTGEISLRGRVMPVGGIKEKILAAMRHAASEVIIPHENYKDLNQLPPVVRRRLRVHTVRSLDEVMKIALRVDPLGEMKVGSATPAVRPVG